MTRRTAERIALGIFIALALLAASGFIIRIGTAHAAPVSRGTNISRGDSTTDVAKPETPQVTITLRALARLHEYGYTINTPARAARAIRHWQTANGLTPDGIVGPATLASLDMTATATASAPAERTTPPPAPAADPEQIIRDIWPDELEDRAVAIATRESRLTPSARNACCYGLFQIHWTAHRAWLADIGITSASELLDPTTNTIAALELYHRDGWSPWDL